VLFVLCLPFVFKAHRSSVTFKNANKVAMAKAMLTSEIQDNSLLRGRERRRLQRAFNGYQKEKHAEKDRAQPQSHFSDDSKEMRQQALKMFKEY
jgi:hypothetical protein